MTDFETQVLIELQAIRRILENIGSTSKNLDISKNTVPTNPQEISIQSDCDDVTKSKDVTILYFGTPDGSGFEENNMIPDGNNPRVLYALETKDGINGKFYPLNKGLSRLRSNAKSFLFPLCDLSDSFDTTDALNISKDNYGEIKLEDGYWKVIRKCRL